MLLADLLEKKFRLDKKQKKALQRLKIFSVEDLLFYFPSRYSHISVIKKINQLVAGEQVTIYGRFWNPEIKTGYYNKISRASGEISDETGKIDVIWFNQAFVAKLLKNGELLELTGRVTEGKLGLYLANPEFKKIKHLPVDKHDSLFSSATSKTNFGFPVYPETKGITSKWIYHAIKKIIQEKVLDQLVDYIPEEILKKYNLPSLKSALVWIHLPKDEKNAQVAHKRFAFDEIFCIQLERQHDKFEYKRKESIKILQDKKEIEKFINSFPFSLTMSQKNVIESILLDLSKNFPTSRLIEGDVGSGKTVIAVVVAFVVSNSMAKNDLMSGLQIAYMAPTEILANQHFESFVQYFSRNSQSPASQSAASQSPALGPINIALMTSSGCKKFPSKLDSEKWTDVSRSQLLKWIASGEISILIGTHSLISKAVKFKKLALVIVDEQHRFGVSQRNKLVRKGEPTPHFISMTATPMPRTLALTIYGDLDISLIEEMPAGRKQIITEIVTPDKREETYEKIKTELEKGRQLFVICPRIIEPDIDKEIKLNIKSAISEAKRLKKEVFPDYKIDVIHSRLAKIKKEKIMKDFSEGKLNILCATSIVEVGVNIPNATIIIIESAERFGLAQLHQLRGRVLRSQHQAYCYVFAETANEKTMKRLQAFQTAKNGFELAELDLLLRGSGELSGDRQWGISDIGMEAIKNQKMVEAARAEASNLIEKDLELSQYPLLKSKVKQKAGEFHFE